MIFKDIFLFLKKRKFNVYSIGQHTGLCKNNYVVIKDAGTLGLNNNGKIHQFEVILFSPFGSYTDFLEFEELVKETLKTFNNIEQVFDASPHMTDDDKKAYTTTLFYKVNKFY